MKNVEIVFVDDEEQNLYVYKKTFKKIFDLKTFSNPVEAKDYLLQKNSKPLVVVTDQTMPEMKGEELARALALEKEYLNFIMITGNLEEDDGLSSRILSKKFFFDYLEKPINWIEDSDSIVNTIKTAASYSWRNLLTMYRARALEFYCSNPYEMEDYVKLNGLVKEIKLEKNSVRMFMIFDKFIISEGINEIAEITKSDSNHELKYLPTNDVQSFSSLEQAFSELRSKITS